MITKEVYVACDGKEFYDKDKCEEHEKDLDRRQFKRLIEAIKTLASNEGLCWECDLCPLANLCTKFFHDFPPCKWDKQEILRFNIMEGQ